MIRTYQKSIGSPILTFHDGEQAGLLRQIVVDPENGKIVGLVVLAKIHRRMKTMTIAGIDILEWGKNIIIQDESSFSEPGEIIRLASILKEKNFIYKKSVFTLNGNYVGQVSDYFFDSESLVIIKLLIRETKWFFWVRRE